MDKITDIENDSIDVYVESEDVYTYTVSIATTKNTLQRINQEKNSFSNLVNLLSLCEN